ncbi:MAG: YceI family protein [Bacteroidota bacterium]
MKTQILLLTFVMSTLTFAHAQDTLTVDTSKSTLKWYGDHTFFFGGHYGTIDFKEGYFIKTGDKITGGSFVIDMDTIKNTDGDYSEGLVSHLKDEDFFDVKKHPISSLVITHVSYHDSTKMEIHADLTIKGITLPIKFQAEADYEKEQLNTRFKIDRTRWGITYNSKIKENAISDAIGFEVTISIN